MSESYGIPRPATGRSFLKPPSVNRKSHSFNTADRNKIKELPPQTNYGTASRISRTVKTNSNGIPPPSNIGGPRSNSLNAKHHFTTKLVQSTTVQNASTKRNPGKSGLVKVENSNNVQRNNNSNSLGRQRLTKVKKPAVGIDSPSLNVTEKKQIRAAKSTPGPVNTKLKIPTSKIAAKSKIASPSNTLTKKKVSNSAPTSIKRETKTTTNSAAKSSSVLGRLKKLGSPSTNSSTIPNNNSTGITLKQATPVKSPSEDAIAKSGKKVKKIGVPKLSNGTNSRLVYKGSPSKNGVKQSGIKSTFQRAFGKADSDKENEQQRPEISAPISEPKSLPKYKQPPMEIVQNIITDSLNNNTVPDKQRLVKIDVNNLLVPPYENNFTKTEMENTVSESDDDSSISLSNSIENGSKFIRPSCEAPLSPRPTHLGVRNVQLPTSYDDRNPEKIATVAPFCRKFSIENEDQVGDGVVKVSPSTEEDSLKNTDSNLSSEKRPSSITVNNNASHEERRQTARGIADLRQNLEQTMSTLRSTQLRNRLSDDFERRISAHLDEEIGALPEVPPPLLSANGYQTIQLGTRMPKLHAGESIVPDSFSNARMSKNYSSLQRIRKPAWEEVSKKPVVPVVDKSEISISDDLSSVSSGDISEYMEGMSLDGLSSNNNSPYHTATNSKATPNLPLSDTLHNKVMNNLQMQSPSPSEPDENKNKEKLEVKTNSPKKNKKSSKSDKKKDKILEGSLAVGSRLADIERSESPCNMTTSPYFKSSFDARNNLAYRSLPRPRKSVMTSSNDIKLNRASKCGSIGDLIEEEKEIDKEDGRSSSNSFVRSPSLKILLRSKAKKKQLQEKSLSEAKDKTDYISQSIYDGSSDMDTYSGKKHQSFSAISNTSLLSNTQSLPRHFSARRKLGNTTWADPRNKANSAYSVPVTPGENEQSDNLSMFSLYSSTNNVENSFNNLTVPDYNNFTDALNTSFQSTSLKSAHTVGKNAHTKSDFRLASSTHDLLSLSSKRNPSTKPQRSSYSAAEADAKSIETATTFLYTLAKNKATESANMIQEFESSLLHLTNRLRELTESADVKDKELNELKSMIKRIKVNGEKSPELDWKETTNLRKKASCTSLCSMSSQTSIASSIASNEEDLKKKKSKHWFRNSFRTAFGKNKSRTSLNEDCISPSNNQARSFSSESCDPETVQGLKDQLRQKEQKLTDIRLEALTSQHQLQHMQDTMSKMRAEMEKLKQENESLHRIGLSSYPYATLKLSKQSKQLKQTMQDIKHEVNVQIKVAIPHYGQSTMENILVTATDISLSVSWQELDGKIKSLLVGYCHTIDPSNSLELDEDSIYSYTVGNYERKCNAQFPTNPPKDYLNASVNSIEIKMRDCRSDSVDSLAFELLIDRHTISDYKRALLKYKRIVISGPIGTGKSLLANRLAGHVAGRDKLGGKVVHLDAKLKEACELRDFLNNLTNNGSSTKCAETTVVILDNIRNPALLRTLFEPLLSGNKQLSPNLYFICVLPYCDESTLHHQHFHSIVFSSSTQPVQSQLTRKLRRSYIENQISNNQNTIDELLSVVILWLPKCCQHVNNCLENFDENDITIGPRMFSDCPMNASSSRVWFADIWNYKVVPYVTSAIKYYMKRTNTFPSEISTKWKDPTLWVKETMPWDDLDLLYIKLSDIVVSPGTDSELSITSQTQSATSSASDPLLNMLMRLQEAANYDSQDEQSMEQAVTNETT